MQIKRVSVSSTLEFLCLALTVCFAALIINGFGERFFSPDCATNDARQQVFHFYRALDPSIFKGDLIYDSMRAYLPPLHFGIGYFITKLTGNPIITSHVMMSLQLLIAGLGLFGAVRVLGGVIPACIAVVWFLNTRSIIHLNAGGLPRGWIAPVLAVYLYLLVSSFERREWRIWVWMMVGALLNPVATFIVLTTHSLFHLVSLIRSDRRVDFIRRKMVPFAAVALLVVGLVFATTSRPPELGKMATLAEASELQGFSKLGGRFPLLPFSEPLHEFKTVGLQPFIGRWATVSEVTKRNLSAALVVTLFTMLGALIYRIRTGGQLFKLLAPELLCFGLAVVVGYFLSRTFAFTLYIPDRYLGSPLSLFWVTFIPVMIWRLLSTNDLIRSFTIKGVPVRVVGVFGFLAIVFMSTGVGNSGRQMFDVCYSQRAALWDFLKQSTPPDAFIAGHPTTLDGVQLFAQRAGYITTETAHPFYDVYYREVKRRLVLVFEAHFAMSWEQFYELLAKEGVDYFCFRTADFDLKRSSPVRYEIPFNNLLKRLSAGPISSYVFSSLPAEVNRSQVPFMVARTSSEAIVDVARLGEYLAGERAGSPAGGLNLKPLDERP